MANGTPIDELIIDIEAKSSNADETIDKLAKAIGNLASSLSGVDVGKLNSLGNGMKNLSNSLATMKSIDTRSISSVVNKINSLSKIDTSQFATVSANLHQMANGIQSLGTVSANVASVGELASNISKLGNKSVQTAVTNIPQLATALNGLMTTLSQAPKVSQNVIQMTNALANLSAQGSKVGSASSSIVKGLNRASASATKAKGSFKGLAYMFGKFYANCFLVIRGVKALWNSINSTADYLEAFNYFEVALNKVGSDWASDYEKYGYENAEAYANSFKTRLNESLSGLSGVQISIDANGETGLLTDTGMKNLGLNIQEVTQYASQLASVTNSVGQTGEVTLATASAFTKLGADMSSLFNTDYSTVMNNLQSGLIGQSRALYKYGIDITNATLQTYAYDLGVEKAVSEMTQAEKMQLRMIAILDQSKVAWGDQANTINSLSNSIRQFKNNISEAGQILGQLFVPILSKVMPIVNGLTIAIKRLMVSIANIMGIELDLSEFGQGTSDVSDDVYDLSESLDDATTSAENLKKATSTLGIDELNVNSPNTDTSSSTSSSSSSTGLDLTDEILKATGEYESAWQEAYDRMENKAQVFADKITNALEPVKKIFQDFAVGDFFQAGQDVSNLVVSITDFFAKAIDNVDWYGIGIKIGDFLAGIEWLKVFKSVGNLMWQGLKATLELAVGVFDSAPLETALISLATMPKWLKAITASKYVTGFKKLAKAIGLVVSGLAGNKTSTKLLITQYPKLGAAVDVARKAFANFQFGVDNGNLFTGLNEGISTIRNNLTGLQKGTITAIAGFAEFRIVKTSFADIVSGSENVVASIIKIGSVAGIAATAMYTALGPAGLAIAGITGVVAAISGINEAFDSIRAEEIGQSIKNAMTVPGGTPISEIAENFSNTMQSIGENFSSISEKSNELKNADSNIEDTWLEIEKIETSMDAGVISVEEGTTRLSELFGELADTASEKFGTLEDTLLVAFGENGVLSDVYNRLGISTENTTSTIIQLNDKVEKRIEELVKLLAETDPSNPNYVMYKEELASLMTQTDELTSAVNDYEVALSQIDYSNLFDDEGNIGTEALEKLLEEISTATKNAQENVASAVNDIRNSLNKELNAALEIGDTESAAEIQEKLNALPDALNLLNNDIALKAIEITDTIQNDFIGRTEGVIDNAINEWNDKNFIQKWWSGFLGGPGNEEEYVKEAVDKQQENIDEVSDAIEEALDELGVDGVAWASEAAEEIYGALFEAPEFNHLLGHYVQPLNENYKEIINGATEGLAELAGERGKDATDGYENAFSNTESLKGAVGEYINAGLEEAAEAQDSHSPSKEYEKLGKYAVDGYNLGFSENQESTLSVIRKFVQNSLKEFEEIISPMYDIGENVMQGLYNGLSGMEESLYDKAEEIANNIANTIKTALDIHSPSRVMAELGEYTIEGFKEGMENLYKPTLDSLKGFSYDVEVAPVPELPSYTSYVSKTLAEFEYGNSTFGQLENLNTEKSEVLLREQNELLRAILEKNVSVKIGDRQIVESYNRGRARMGYSFT